MSAHTAPVFVTVSPWAPSLPNSDAWTLGSIIDDAGLKQVVAVPTVPLGTQTNISMAPAAADTTPSAQLVPRSVPATQPRRSPIGRGHPTCSKQRNQSVQPAAVAAAAAAPSQTAPAVAAAAAPTQLPQPRARINSSTIKPRTERFPARTLFTIFEEPSVRFITTNTNTPAPLRCAEEHSTPAQAPRCTESNHESSAMTIKFKTVNGVAQSATSWADEFEAEMFEREAGAQKLYSSWADEVDAEMERDAVKTGENELEWEEGVAAKFTMRVRFGSVCLF
ncbi:hypothetical protein DFH06DRAFT_1243986 [Mycena polygramma]|nr:hypothetical protein DFH06DRAFT_1243986 [Mycena polygramma]